MIIFSHSYYNEKFGDINDLKLIGSDLVIKSDLISCRRCPVYYKGIDCSIFESSCVRGLTRLGFREYIGYKLIAKDMSLYESRYLKKIKCNVLGFHSN